MVLHQKFGSGSAQGDCCKICPDYVSEPYLSQDSRIIRGADQGMFVRDVVRDNDYGKFLPPGSDLVEIQPDGLAEPRQTLSPLSIQSFGEISRLIVKNSPNFP